MNFSFGAVAILLVSFLPASLIAYSPVRAQSTSHDTAGQIRELDEQWARAITHGDTATLSNLFAEDLLVISGSGEVRDKKGEMKDLAPAQDANASPFVVRDVTVRSYRKFAISTGIASWTVNWQGKTIEQERRYMHVFAKRGSKWQLIAQQVSANMKASAAH